MSSSRRAPRRGSGRRYREVVDQVGAEPDGGRRRRRRRGRRGRGTARRSRVAVDERPEGVDPHPPVGGGDGASWSSSRLRGMAAQRRHDECEARNGRVATAASWAKPGAERCDTSTTMPSCSINATASTPSRVRRPRCRSRRCRRPSSCDGSRSARRSGCRGARTSRRGRATSRSARPLRGPARGRCARCRRRRARSAAVSTIATSAACRSAIQRAVSTISQGPAQCALADELLLGEQRQHLQHDAAGAQLREPDVTERVGVAALAAVLDGEQQVVVGVGDGGITATVTPPAGRRP